MKLAGFIFGLIAILFVVVVSPTYAHPGRTAADGCHYCRTNCDKWGVAWNERHCHGGGSEGVAPVVVQPIAKPIIVPSATVVAEPTPTSRPIPTITSTPTPTLISNTPVVTASPTPAVTKMQDTRKIEEKKNLVEREEKTFFDYFMNTAMNGLLPQFAIFNIFGK